MILPLAILLGFQLLGEITARGFGLPLPGPVLGMAFLFLALTAWPRLAARITDTARGLLGHLSLLFVPAGVGIVGHLGEMQADGAGLALAIVGSTALAIMAGVGAFLAVVRLTGGAGDAG
ncbi:MAG: CidA/LrgA family protein [Limimaricola sp.]|uniref:CidA/LrgA family protein n=1 Tax=Limimaricola sp. TaxID=2211665 RepID=UPI001D3658A1|nr:CidA/LrgA family protein [Limimaricola sp.]MBI1418691.1 CidA/LrgA family protein [Limimaricola sp.]